MGKHCPWPLTATPTLSTETGRRSGTLGLLPFRPVIRWTVDGKMVRSWDRFRVLYRDRGRL